jgi:hypothetical protein
VAVEARRPGSMRRVLRAQDGDGAFQMMDLILVAIGIGFFALSVGYAYSCERL